ncbi:MAG TPA: LamG domain-containing protein [Verrucomicrobiae bacterium]
MKRLAFLLAINTAAFTFAVQAADTNPPPRLTVELRDGSRVVGASMEKTLKFHSALLGDIKLDVQDIRAVEFVTTNSAKLKAANGDTLVVQPAATSFAIKTGFGKVELATASIRKFSVATANTVIPQRDGLIGFWSGNGTAEDGTGQHPGVLMGGADFVSGPQGQAFHFDSPGSFVKIPKSSDLNPSGQVTVEFWMNAAEANTMNNYQGLVTSDFYGVEISNGYGGKMGVNLFVSTTASQPMRRLGGYDDQMFSSGLRSRITSVANFTHISDANGGGSPVSAGQWHHVAGTYDGTQLRLYIDGQPWGQPVTRPGRIAPMLPESFVSFGSEDGRATCPECVNNRYFKGAISQVAIYKRALTAAEINEDYQAGKAD